MHVLTDFVIRNIIYLIRQCVLTNLKSCTITLDKAIVKYNSIVKLYRLLLIASIDFEVFDSIFTLRNFPKYNFHIKYSHASPTKMMFYIHWLQFPQHAMHVV